MGRSMEYVEFCNVVEVKVRECCDNTAKVEVHKVTKNNSLELDALVILKDNKNMSPNFYLQHYYSEYIEGKSLDAIVDSIIETYNRAESEAGDMNIDLSFSACYDKIIYRLVSHDKNKELLGTVPYIPFLDMVITFHYLIMEDNSGIGSIRITNELLEEWNVDIKQLFELAQHNTMRIFPSQICSMRRTLLGMIESMADCEKEAMDQMLREEPADGSGEPYVITNTKGINGAAVLLYPAVLQDMAEILQGDFYILPSSIHEVLVIPDCGVYSGDELEDMVRDVNSNCVLPDEILSEKVYHYSFESNCVEICS